MEKLLDYMDDLLKSVTPKDIENMTSEQRKEFIGLMEKLEARVDVIKNMQEEGGK